MAFTEQSVDDTRRHLVEALLRLTSAWCRPSETPTTRGETTEKKPRLHNPVHYASIGKRKEGKRVRVVFAVCTDASRSFRFFCCCGNDYADRYLKWMPRMVGLQSWWNVFTTRPRYLESWTRPVRLGPNESEFDLSWAKRKTLKGNNQRRRHGLWRHPTRRGRVRQVPATDGVAGAAARNDSVRISRLQSALHGHRSAAPLPPSARRPSLQRQVRRFFFSFLYFFTTRATLWSISYALRSIPPLGSCSMYAVNASSGDSGDSVVACQFGWEFHPEDPSVTSIVQEVGKRWRHQTNLLPPLPPKKKNQKAYLTRSKFIFMEFYWSFTK